MELLKIDKATDIPPVSGYTKTHIYRETSKAMNAGESVLLEDRSEANAFCTVAKKPKENLHYKFTQRKVEDGIRVWKIKHK
jgi:hypothetical protein